MRYPLVILILVMLSLAMPTEKYRPDTPRDRVISHVLPPGMERDLALPKPSELFSEETRANADAAMEALRAMPPAHQLLFVMQVVVLTVCSACVISYLLHSIASLAGFGFTLTVLFIFTALLAIAILTGGRKPRLMKWMEKYTEMGPFIRRLKMRGWQKRFAHAARTHGFNPNHPELARVRVRTR